MRIASYYPDVQTVGRNDGGPLYHTYILRQLFGQDVVTHLFPAKNVTPSAKFDLHYWVDHGEDALGFTDLVCPKPNVYVSSDTHLGFEYRLQKAREFDWVFCNQHKAQEEFIEKGIPEDKCHWLPHAFDPMAYSPGVFNKNTNKWLTEAYVPKKYDICFVGNLNDRNRVDHLDVLFKEFPNSFWCTRRFHDAAEVFNHSRIVFNVSSRKELNMRVFETLGSRAFLLTDRIPESEDVFKENTHYVAYNDHTEMVNKARYYLNHEAEREQIAQAGYREAISKHTYLHRVKKVLDTANIPYPKDRMEELLKNQMEEVYASVN